MSSQSNLTVRFLCKESRFHWHACIYRRILCYPWWNSSRRLTDLSSSAASPVAVFIEQVPFSNSATETCRDGWMAHSCQSSWLPFFSSFFFCLSSATLYDKQKLGGQKIWLFGHHVFNYTQQTLNGLSCQPCCIHTRFSFSYPWLDLMDRFPHKVGQRNAMPLKWKNRWENGRFYRIQAISLPSHW